MAHFVRLTLAESHQPFLLNVACVADVRPDGDGRTLVLLHGGEYRVVAGDHAEVRRQLYGGPAVSPVAAPDVAGGWLRGHELLGKFLTFAGVFLLIVGPIWRPVGN